MNTSVPNYEEKFEFSDNFDEFLEQIKLWLVSQKTKMRRFLGVDYEIATVLDEKKDTFAFSPANRKVYIPIKWLKQFHKRLLSHESIGTWNGSEFLHTFLDFEFGLYHELSHFRDLIMENSTSGKKSMIDILKHVNNQKVQFGTKKYIPIGNSLHALVNCVDDIIVNKEVEIDLGSGFTKEKINGLYKYNMFADIIEKKGGLML